MLTVLQGGIWEVVIQPNRCCSLPIAARAAAFWDSYSWFSRVASYKAYYNSPSTRQPSHGSPSEEPIGHSKDVTDALDELVQRPSRLQLPSALQVGAVSLKGSSDYTPGPNEEVQPVPGKDGRFPTSEGPITHNHNESKTYPQNKP